MKNANCCNHIQYIRLVLIAVGSAICMYSNQSVLAADPVDGTALRNAWALYTQQKYAASADAFENLIRTSAPNPRLYYYAAMANKGCNRLARAKQLCDYLCANFFGSTEATYAKKLLNEVSSTNSGTPDALPDNLKGKTVEELMQTEEGRKALKEALNQQKAKPSASPAVASSAPSSPPKAKPANQNAQAIPPTAIASDGPAGITEFSYYPNCGLESSMAALAVLPRGQELISSMIRSTDGRGTYTVRFPGDGVEHLITPQTIEESRMRDKALWATLIHCAQAMETHSYGGTIDQGLTLLTGKKAETIHPANTTQQVLTRFIADAVKSQIPIVCQSGDDFGSLPELAEADHAYTITGFDSTTNMITMRNPHGENSRRFRLKTDPEHQKFEQLNDGVFKMHISLFPQYFAEVARSSF
jgi:tetratricopeptide (TPR) repeat protein